MDEGFIPPVPFSWLKKFRGLVPSRRGTSPCIAICTAMALYYTYKISKNPTFKLTRATQTRFGINRHNMRRALKIWEKAGLIRIQGVNGQALTITLLEETPPSSFST